MDFTRIDPQTIMWAIAKAVFLAVGGAEGIVAVIKAIARRRSAEHKMLVGLTRKSLKDEMLNAIIRDYTTPTQMEVVSKLYAPYIKNGGNGYIKDLYERFMDLPVREHTREG